MSPSHSVLWMDSHPDLQVAWGCEESHHKSPWLQRHSGHRIHSLSLSAWLFQTSQVIGFNGCFFLVIVEVKGKGYATHIPKTSKVSPSIYIYTSVMFEQRIVRLYSGCLFSHFQADLITDD